MARFTRVLSVFAVLLLVSACGGGGGNGSSGTSEPVVVDSNADYSVTYEDNIGGRPTVLANGSVSVDPGSSQSITQDTFIVKAQKKNVTISTLVFRCVGDCSLIKDIYFMYLSSTQTGFLSVKASLESDGTVIVNFNPALNAEIGAEGFKTWLGAGYNIASFDSNHASATFHLDYDGTDSRNMAVETATGLPAAGNKQVIATPGHIICPQTVLSDSWSCM